MKNFILFTFMVVVPVVFHGQAYAALPAGSQLVAPRVLEPMVIDQKAIEATIVEVRFNGSGEVVQINACESEYLCTEARMLPAKGIQFYVGESRLDMESVRQMNKRAATIIYDAESGMVEKVRYFEVARSVSDE